MKTISLIIVNYNGKRFLKRLLDSVYNQIFKDFEVIFVDNGSADDSIEFVKNNYSEVIIIPSENNGYGSACNLGAKKATGKYIAFFNEDMYLPNNFLEKIIEFRNNLSDQEKIGGVSCKIIDFDSSTDFFPSTYGAKIDLLGFTVKSKKQENAFSISACPFMIRRDLFEKIGGFNEMIFIYGEDLDLSWRLTIFGYRNYTTNSTYLHHFAGGATGNFGPKKVADIVFGAFVPIFTNYNIFSLIFVFPMFFAFAFLFYAFLVIIKFDGRYLCEILKKKIVFFKKIRRAFEIRKFVQKNRTKSDFQMMRFISFIPAFFLNNSIKKLKKNYVVRNA